jgi:PAS domain S-box-containing protein
MTADRRLRAALMPYQPRLLHEVLDSLDVAVIVLDEASHVLAGNLAASRLLGVRRGRRSGDAPYASVVQVVDEEGTPVDVVAFAFWRAQAARGGAPLSLRVTRDGGSVRWLSATAQVVADEVDGSEAVVCRYVDVTARRELERRAAIATDHAARAEIDLVAAEQRVALLVELLMQLATGQAVPG